jgi:hypothetical protein
MDESGNVFAGPGSILTSKDRSSVGRIDPDQSRIDHSCPRIDPTPV